MSTLVINGRPFAAGLYWLDRAGPAATARAAHRLAASRDAHPLALALADSIKSEFWMALVAGDAATGNSTDTVDTGHYALIKVRDGALLADGDEVFTGRDAAVEAFARARALGWDLYATPGLLSGGADHDVTELDVSSLAAVPENVLRRVPFTRIGRAHVALALLLPAGSAFLFVALEFLAAGLDLNDRAFEDLKRHASPYARHRIGAIQRGMARGAGLGRAMALAGHGFPDPALVPVAAALDGAPGWEDKLARFVERWVGRSEDLLKSRAAALNGALLIVVTLAMAAGIDAMFSVLQQAGRS